MKQQKLTINLEQVESTADSDQQIYEGLKNWKSAHEELLKSEFIDQIDWLPVVTFVLGTITTGFLKAIGSEIWANAKRLFADAKVGPPRFEFKFSYEGVEIEARVESDDLQVIKQALDNLDELVTQIDPQQQEEVNFIWTGANNWQEK